MPSPLYTCTTMPPGPQHATLHMCKPPLGKLRWLCFKESRQESSTVQLESKVQAQKHYFQSVLFLLFTLVNDYYFMCMGALPMSMQHICAVHTEARRRRQIPWDWSSKKIHHESAGN